MFTSSQCWKCRDILSTFHGSGHPDTISAYDSRMKEEFAKIVDIWATISKGTSTWNKHTCRGFFFFFFAFLLIYRSLFDSHNSFRVDPTARIEFGNSL